MLMNLHAPPGDAIALKSLFGGGGAAVTRLLKSLLSLANKHCDNKYHRTDLKL